MLSFDGDHHFVEMSPIDRGSAAFTNLLGIVLRKLLAPISDDFISHLDAAIEHHFLDITVAQGKSVIEPDTVTNDLHRKSVAFVAVAHGDCP